MEDIKLLRMVLSTTNTKMPKDSRTREDEADTLDLMEAIIENRFIEREWRLDYPPRLYMVLKEAFPGATHPVWNHIPLFEGEQDGG